MAENESDTGPQTPPEGAAPLPPGAEQAGAEAPPALETDQNARTMGMLAHLLGLIGFVGPLIIWLIKREESAFVDNQGKEALNFQLTLLIVWIVGGVTTFFCVGFFILLAAMIIDLIFCIMGAMKANKGERYRYPVSIRFIK
jgi:uncharacterized Tic20 family protein